MISSEKKIFTTAPQAGSPNNVHEHFNINVQKSYHDLVPVLSKPDASSGTGGPQGSLKSLRQGSSGTQAKKTQIAQKMGTTQMINSIMDSSKKRKQTKLIWGASVPVANSSVGRIEQSMESSASYFVGGSPNEHRQVRNSSRRLPKLQQQGEMPKLKQEEIANAYLTSTVKRTPKHQRGYSDTYETPNRGQNNSSQKRGGDSYLKKAKALELQLLRGLNGLSSQGRRQKTGAKATEGKKVRSERKKVSHFSVTKGDKSQNQGHLGTGNMDLSHIEGRNFGISQTSTSRNLQTRSIQKMKTQETSTSTDSRFKEGRLPLITSQNTTRALEVVSDVSILGGLGTPNFNHAPQSTRARDGKKPMFPISIEVSGAESQRDVGIKNQGTPGSDSLSSRLIYNLSRKPNYVAKFGSKGDSPGSQNGTRKRTVVTKTGSKRGISQMGKKNTSSPVNVAGLTVGGLTSNSNATMQTLSQTPHSSDQSQGFENACKKVTFEASDLASTSTLMYDPIVRLKLKLIRCKVV